MNLSKSKHILFSLNYRNDCQCTGDIPFESVTSAVLLGITFQRNCYFTRHIDLLLNKLRRLTYVFRDLINSNVSIADRTLVYEALVISRCRYGISVYGSKNSSLEKLQEFLNHSYRHGFTGKHYSIFTLRDEEDLRNARRIQMNLKHPLRNELLKYNIELPDGRLRNPRAHDIPKTNTVAYSSSFVFRARKLLNP